MGMGNARFDLLYTKIYRRFPFTVTNFPFLKLLRIANLLIQTFHLGVEGRIHGTRSCCQRTQGHEQRSFMKGHPK